MVSSCYHQLSIYLHHIRKFYSFLEVNANKEYIVQLKTERDNASKNSDEEAKNKQTEEENKKNQESDELKNKLDNDLKDKKEKEKQDAQNNSSDGSYDNTNVQTNGKVIFLGDSRTVGLEYIGKNDPNTYFVCEGGMGYNWFLTTGIMRVNQIALTDGYTILFNLGVNGTVLKDKINENQAKGYVSKIKELACGLWSKHKIVIASVFPINEETNKYAVNNNGVVLFNNYMKDNLQGISNVSYCDVYNGLDRSKFIDSGDGLHFSSDGYRNIYNYMKQNCV